MKNLGILIMAIMILSAGKLFAQDYNPMLHCMGLKNPTNFTLTGGTGETMWTGYVGSKAAQASTCTSIPLFNSATVVTANNLTTQTSSTSCTSNNSVDISGQNDYQKRFSIKGRGLDPATGNHLTYTPAVYTNGVNYTLDSEYTSSIRLGNFCGGGEAEGLTFQMKVNANNALVTIWYAMSLQNGQHNAAQNPEFVIHVEKKVGTNWVRIGGDTLCYVQPSPTISTTDLSATGGYNFYVGSTGTHTGASYGCNVYLPWQKVIIDLYKYNYETIRFKISAGDCSQTAHYACCYIAGDCQPMKLQANGCAAGSSENVATISAPKGMNSYQWYRSRTGVLNNEQSLNDANYVMIQGATDSILNVQMPHFFHQNGDTLTQNTFRCVMTSLMNQNHPNYLVTSKLQTNVGNTKPTIHIDSSLLCDGTVIVRDLSIARFTTSEADEVDTNLTIWKFYNTQTPGLLPAATLTGGTVSHTFDNPGMHCVTIQTMSSVTDESGHHTCWNEKTIPIRSIVPATPLIEVSETDICPGDTVIVYDRTVGSIYHRWHFWTDSGFDTTYVSPGPATQFIFRESTYINITAHDRSNYRADEDHDGILETHYCDVDTTIFVRVGKYPTLLVTGDTIVCNGTQSIVNVNSDVPNCTYDWYTDPRFNPIQSNTSTLTTTPSDDVRYYVRVTSPEGCISWDSLDITIVKPTLGFSTKYGSPQICVGDTVTLWSGNAATYTWTIEPDNDPSFWGQEHKDTIRCTPEQTITYSVVGHGTNGCSSTALKKQIQVFPYPIIGIQLTPDYIDSENPSVQFSDTSLYSSNSLWNFGNGYTTTTRSVVYTFTDLSQDSILITLTSSNPLGCSRDTSFWIPIGIFTVWFPNAFTPLLESNSIFKVYTANELIDFELYIYDRAGALVFQTRDQNEGWDGTYKGHDCKEGAYVYICKYRRKGVERLMNKKGTVTLLR